MEVIQHLIDIINKKYGSDNIDQLKKNMFMDAWFAWEIANAQIICLKQSRDKKYQQVLILVPINSIPHKKCGSSLVVVKRYQKVIHDR